MQRCTLRTLPVSAGGFRPAVGSLWIGGALVASSAEQASALERLRLRLGSPLIAARPILPVC